MLVYSWGSMELNLYCKKEKLYCVTFVVAPTISKGTIKLGKEHKILAYCIRFCACLVHSYNVPVVTKSTKCEGLMDALSPVLRTRLVQAALTAYSISALFV